MSKTSEWQKKYYKEWYQKNKKRLTKERREYLKEYMPKWREKTEKNIMPMRESGEQSKKRSNSNGQRRTK